jgi:DNA helicase-2/ATP-dependent DNA helicase PcrA
MSSFRTQDLCSLMGIDFSEEQLRAITAPLEPSVIMAGAGSGKTSVMTARVVWLVATAGIAPQGVLGLTFTNKAAGEFRSRVRSALAKLELPAESADATTVTTYHAFAQQLLVDEGLRIGIEPEVQLLSDVRREQLAMQVVRRPAIEIVELSHSSKSIVTRLLTLDDRLAEEAVEIDAVREFDRHLIERLSAHDQQVAGRDIVETAMERLEALALVEQFRDLKLRKQCIDYADMVRLALRLVREREEVAIRLRTQYPVVLLDEYQDTSVAQRMLMQQAFTAGHAITAVGDALQAIYEWRGASAINIIDFPRHFARSLPDGSQAEAPVFGLPKTQRFGSNISAAANDITETLRSGMRHVQALESQSDDRFGAGRIDVALHADQASEFAWIAGQLHEAHGTTQWKDMAVLLRQHRYSADLYEVLTAAGIPAQILGKQGLLRIPDIADVVAYLRVIHDPAANPSWVRILSGMRYRLGLRDIAHLGHRARELARVELDEGWEAALLHAASGSDVVDVVALGEAIADPGDSGDLSAEARARIAELHAEIGAFRRFAGLPIVELVRTVVHRIGLDIEIEASDRAVARGRRAALESFIELVAGFMSLDGSHSLTAFLQWLDDGDHLDRQAQIEYPMDRNAVSIMTVHAAKGLQRDVIVLPALVEGVFPSDRSDSAWTGSADALPFAVLHSEVDPELLAYPSDRPRSIDAKAFSELLKPRKLAEETRLAYVAVTRAQRRLIATAARSYGGKVVEPSRFLVQLREAAQANGGAVHAWAESADETDTTTVERAPWPQEPEAQYAAAMSSLVEAVLVAEDLSAGDGIETGSSVAARLAAWDAAIEHHTAQRLAARNVDHAVPLPASLSATQVQALVKDASAFLADLVRPMPRQPALAAKRGSAFHAWIERQYGQQLLLGDDLADDDVALDALREAFLRSEWAGRTPLALELPFVIGLGRFCIRGRIDAVYREGDDIVVVDWKTNAKASSDPLQLSIYAHAAAAHYGVPIERVRACFFYVAQGRTQWHEPVDVLAQVDPSVPDRVAEPVLDGAPRDRDA